MNFKYDNGIRIWSNFRTFPFSFFFFEHVYWDFPECMQRLQMVN